MTLKYLKLLREIQEEFNEFKSILELAFDLDVNIAFEGSVKLAQHVGVKSDKILYDKIAIDNFFMN